MSHTTVYHFNSHVQCEPGLAGVDISLIFLLHLLKPVHPLKTDQNL